MNDFNDGRHISTVMARSTCKQHDAREGFPCYQIPRDDSYSYFGVCGKRIRAAGYNGKITPASLSLRSGNPVGRSRIRSRA